MSQTPPYRGARVVPPGTESDGDGVFKPSLDTSQILRDFNKRWANPGAPKVDETLPWWAQAPGALEAAETAKLDAAIAKERAEKQENEPYRSGWKEVEFSTCQDLVQIPLLCWDVNGYYRTMGVHWKATKKELMIAFHEFGPMPSAYQMYVFKQLLNVAIRREYDRCPLGAPYLNDDYVQDAMKAKASDEARRRSQEGQPTSAQDIINENYQFIPEDDTPDLGLDGAPDEDKSAELSEADLTFQWPFSYFLWRAKEREETEQRMATWQRVLVRALASEGLVLQLAVGSLGKQPYPFAVVQVGDTRVIFLNEKEEPTEDLAASVASTISTMR